MTLCRLLIAVGLSSVCAFARAESFDVVVYGSSPAALSAAVQATRLGRRVVVVSPETRIGGLTTGGLGATDIGNKAAFGGLALRFYEDVAAFYGSTNASMWAFEPSAALKILEGWEKREKLVIHRGKRLWREEGKVKVEGQGGGGERRIASFVTEDGTEYVGKVFVDATYEGDLMAAAGVSYTVGREANALYGETLDGVETSRARYHQLRPGIDPYVVPGDKTSGLLPGVEPFDPSEKDGAGDRRVQAYCFRMCLTDVPENRIPFAKPAGYDERQYELLFRNFEAGETQIPLGTCRMPNGKTDTNNRGGFSTDFIGYNWNWAEASYAARERTLREHLVYQQGLMWTLANHPRVPEAVRREVSRWGLCKDEFLDGFGVGWPRQLYVREARRMIGDYVMTEANCRRRRMAPRPVAMAAYTMDSHHVRRHVGADGFVHNEGDVQVSNGDVPYPIDYGSILPKRTECENLLVPVCLSASHIAFGSIRMEPVFFALGQAAGTAAALAVQKGCALHDVPYEELSARLAADGQVLSWKTPDTALDLGSKDQRARQPKAVGPNFDCGLVAGEAADGGACAYRFQITKPWNGELPKLVTAELKPAVTNWTAYDRLVLFVHNDAIGGDFLGLYVSKPTGDFADGLFPKFLPLGDHDCVPWVVPLKDWPKTADPANVGRITIYMTWPSAADVRVSGFYLLKPGERVPRPDDLYMEKYVRPARARAAALRREAHSASRARFRARCQAAGQTGTPCWIGKATSMQKVRPRADRFDVAAADSFSLKLARGEYESFQVLVMPNGADLTNVTVAVSGLEGLPLSSFKVSPVGYVKTVNPPPYKGAENVATNLPGGYWRKTCALETGWWPDPILDWLDTADVKDGDLQSFWVRCHCPRDQRAGTYAGTVTVKSEGWSRAFPLTVRVYDFAVPKTSPLPLQLSFAPEPNEQTRDPDQILLNKRLWADPLAPINAWRKHETAWGAFLADYYITMDNIYHDGRGIHWNVLGRLKAEGRLGVFNLGYWKPVSALTDATKRDWQADVQRLIRPNYEKARELGLLDHAYLYGCDEMPTNEFPRIRWAVEELKRMFPGVPIATTAYDRQFGTGDSVLSAMDWFCPTTERYAEDAARLPAARSSGHQVWWYIACGPKAPYANMFIEYEGIEGRLLMGAQTVKFRPDGFLYWQMTNWNAARPISGRDTFTTWEPRSWTRYHGDGSWFCCGPDATPCATVRVENFRDGLEDYAYAREYERVTGRTCEVPVEVCREIAQFTNDPAVLYAWRDKLAEAIERAKRSSTGIPVKNKDAIIGI